MVAFRSSASRISRPSAVAQPADDPVPTLADACAEGVRQLCPPLTPFDVVCLLAYGPVFSASTHRPAHPLDVETWGRASIQSLLRVAQAIPAELVACGLLPRLEFPPLRAFEFAARRFASWVEWTRRSGGDAREVARRRIVVAALHEVFLVRTRPAQVLTDLRTGLHKVRKQFSERDIEELSRAMRSSGLAAFFISRDGTWRLGWRQIRDFLGLGLPRGRARRKGQGQVTSMEFPVGTELGDDAEGSTPEARAVSLLRGLEHLSEFERLERMDRLSERECTVLELSTDLGAEQVGWGSREHHRRLTGAGFAISQPGLLKLCRRVERKLSG